jgi:DNA-binding MarR family transcriptional regulator
MAVAISRAPLRAAPEISRPCLRLSQELCPFDRAVDWAMMRVMPEPRRRVKQIDQFNTVDQSRESQLNAALELMHFGFRRFIQTPDRILARYRFGRLHHRVLYFVARNPGLSVGELLRILGITKQALHRPLRDLTEGGWVEARPAPHSRRMKLLTLSRKGMRLETQLSGDQRARFDRVFRAVGPAAERAWREVMRRVAEP